MGILNVTPDSFSDGGIVVSVDDASRRVEQMLRQGAGIIDIGGESTRPSSRPVGEEEEIRRTAPVIEAVTKRFDVPVSIDTTKSGVAREAVNAGAEIINDISALRFDGGIGDIAAVSGAALILMHSVGTFETMHSAASSSDIVADVTSDFTRSIDAARSSGVRDRKIALDIGLGFGKTQEQNLELIAKLDKIVSEFEVYPMVVGVSRKSFIGRVLGGAAVNDRLNGSIAAAAIAAFHGARVLRVHDVKETVDAVKIGWAIREQAKL